MFVVLFAGLANAYTRCVLIPSSCSYSNGDGKKDWQAKCNNSGTTGLPYKGVSILASDSGSAGTVKQKLTVTGDPEQDRYCWCMLTYPAASAYVYSGASDVGVYYCATNCSVAFADKSTFRNNMFNSINIDPTNGAL